MHRGLSEIEAWTTYAYVISPTPTQRTARGDDGSSGDEGLSPLHCGTCHEYSIELLVKLWDYWL